MDNGGVDSRHPEGRLRVILGISTSFLRAARSLGNKRVIIQRLYPGLNRL